MSKTQENHALDENHQEKTFSFEIFGNARVFGESHMFDAFSFLGHDGEVQPQNDTSENNRVIETTINRVIETMKLRFTSGNDVPVTRTAITKEEWDIVLDNLKTLS